MKGHFRIERRQLLEQRKEEKKKLSGPVETHTSELKIGTHSGCGLCVDDPIAAPQHCSIAFRDGRFLLRDLGNATGTFLNGERVLEPAPVGDGDRITFGVTILELSQGGAATQTLSIAVDEGAFFYKIKKRGEFESDADEWVRSEVTFGRTPWLSALNVLAIGFAIAVVGGLWFTPQGQAALQPGHLSLAHARLFSADPPRDPRLAFMVEIAREQGCAACHDDSGAITSSRCANCHEELVRTASEERAHPFDATDALDCVRCHREHYGLDPRPDALKPADITSRCVDCHGDDYVDEASVREGIAHAVATFDLFPSTGEPVLHDASLGYEAFDHGRHAGVGDCVTCHVLDDRQASGPDFGVVAFESCMECHALDARVSDERHRPGAAFRWSTTWHGVGTDQAHCRACHAEPHGAALATLEVHGPAPVAFALRPRSHHSFLGGEEGPRDCASCHKSGELRSGQQLLEGLPFRHEQHLSSMEPGDDETRDLVNTQCAQCHTDMAASPGLTPAPAAYVGPSLASCVECHEESGEALITGPGAVLGVSPVRRVPDFPHERHAGVEGGCIACHEFGESADASRGLVPLPTPDDVATCVRCHVERDGETTLAHAAIGGGDCVKCHVPRGEDSPSAPMAAVFYGPRGDTSARSDLTVGGAAGEVATPSASTFPHALDAHSNQSCTECHGDPQVDGDIHSPEVVAASCRECHAQTRFHWR